MAEVKLVAVIGMGSIAARHRQNLKYLFPNAQIAAMSSSGRSCNPEDIDFCDRVYDSLESLCCDEPEFAIVATPSSMRLSFISKLLECGISLLIEKPLASSFAGARELERAISFNKERATASVAYCLRCLDSAIFLKSKLESSAFGEIYSAFIEVGQYLPDWRPDRDYRQCVSANAALGGGALNELSHEIDYAQWFFGPLTLRHAAVRNTGALSIDVEDIADLSLQSEQGVNVRIHLDFLQRLPNRTCVMITEKGRVEWNLIDDQIVLIGKEGRELLYVSNEKNRNKMYIEMLKRFYQQVSSGGESLGLCTPKQALQVAQLIDQARSWV